MNKYQGIITKYAYNIDLRNYIDACKTDDNIIFHNTIKLEQKLNLSLRIDENDGRVTLVSAGLIDTILTFKWVKLLNGQSNSPVEYNFISSDQPHVLGNEKFVLQLPPRKG